MSTPFDLERALRELERDFKGWHTCGEMVRRGGSCNRCGPVPSGSVLLLGDVRIPKVVTHLESASLRGSVRDRTRKALAESFERGAARLVGGDHD